MTTHPDIPYLCYINANSQCDQGLPDTLSVDQLQTAYRMLCLTRAIDKKAVNLQRTGHMGTYPSSLGQEAIGVATGMAMASTDVYAPYYRETGALIQRGMPIEALFSLWGGDERANQPAALQRDLPICVPIATQCLHGAGIAFALQYEGKSAAAVTTIGEGGTSKGDFYEALNLAGAWQLPLVTVVNNNQWAISVPRAAQTHSETIAQKARAAGVPAVQVDGNDVAAVYAALTDALVRARRGDGPMLIEAITYRLCDHTTADDATRYQSPEQLAAAWEKEPIARLYRYLCAAGHWSDTDEAEMQAAHQAEIQAAAQRFLAQDKPRPTDMFDHLYASLPTAYWDQYDALSQES